MSVGQILCRFSSSSHSTAQQPSSGHGSASPRPASAPVAQLSDVLDPWTDPACLNDHSLKLKLFQGGPWYQPYCTLCQKWSDESHTQSDRHLKRLAWHGHELGDPAGGCQVPEELKYLSRNKVTKTLSKAYDNEASWGPPAWPP